MKEDIEELKQSIEEEKKKSKGRPISLETHKRLDILFKLEPMQCAIIAPTAEYNQTNRLRKLIYDAQDGKFQNRVLDNKSDYILFTNLMVTMTLVARIK